MTEIETTIPGRRITAGPTELYIEDTEWPGRRIRTKLLGDDAKKVAEALDPDRAVTLHGHQPGTVGHAMAREIDRLTAERDQLQGRIRYLEKMDAAKEARLAYLTQDQEQRIDALRESYGERVREANTRAEALTAARDGFRDAYDKAFTRARKANARADAAEAKVRELEKAGGVEAKPRIDWRQVHDTIQVLRSQGGSWAEVGKQVEFIWGLDRVEDQQAEQAVDPVEEKTDALADILYGDEMVTDQMRGVLERVVRAGMLLPEQEADQ